MLALLIMHGSILLVTMHPRAHLRELQFFSFLEVYSPSTGTQKEAIPHPRAPDRPHICFLQTSSWSVQKQNDTFSLLLWTFSWFYWQYGNGCHNVVKTWTINLKTKTKKKNSLKRASLIKLACVAGTCERENGRARESVSFSRARFFLCPLLPSLSYAGYDRILHKNTGPNTHIHFKF